MEKTVSIEVTRRYITVARRNLLDVLVDIDLVEQSRGDRAKQRLARELKAMDEFAHSTAAEEYEPS